MPQFSNTSAFFQESVIGMTVIETDKTVNNVLLLFLLSDIGWLYCLQVVVLTSANAKRSLVVQDLAEVALRDKHMD